MSSSLPIQVHLSLVPSGGTQPPPFLDAGERDRLARFRDPASRQRYLEGRRLLRTVLARELDLGPARVPLAISQEGRPELTGDCRDLLHFSLSHSGSVVLLAVHRNGAVGVDVEPDSPVLPDRAALLGRIATAREREGLDPPSGHADPGFRRLWCRKEAVAKGTGRGIPVGLHQVEDPLCGAAGEGWVRLRGEVGRGWATADLQGLPPGYVGAVAVEVERTPSCLPALVRHHEGPIPSGERGRRNRKVDP